MDRAYAPTQSGAQWGGAAPVPSQAPAPQGSYNQPAYQPQQHYAPPPTQPSYAAPSSYPPPNSNEHYGMQQSQPYAPSTGGKPHFGNGKVSAHSSPQEDAYFAPTKPQWHDVWAAALFWAQFAAFIAVAVISLRAYAQTNGSRGATLGGKGSSITLDRSAAYLFSIISGAALVFSIISLVIVRAFTKIILEIALILSVIVTIAYAVYLFIQKMWSGAVIFTLFAIFSVLAYPSMRRRIPLSRALLQTVFKAADAHKSTYVIALVGSTLVALYSVFWSFVLVAAYQKFTTGASGANVSGGSSGTAAQVLVSIFLVFHLYWTEETFSNVLLATEAGIFGSWIFSGNANPPKRVTLGAFKRATTYSFGSIAFGSLIVAFLDMLRAALSLARADAAQSGDMLGAACACFAQCCVGCIQSLVEYFNRYAYIDIALFGRSYVQSAKETWKLFKDRGIDALINDCLVNNIWGIMTFVVGALCSAFAYLYMRIVEPTYISSGSGLYAVIIGYGFILGAFVANCLGRVCISAGVDTIFVALAHEPQALAEKDPALFAEIARAYPKVTSPI